jgi:hypothetical protein
MESKQNGSQELSRIPRPDYAQHLAYGKLFGAPSLATRRQALQRFIPHFRDALTAKMRYDRARKKIERGASLPLYQEMRRVGAVGIRVSPEDRAQVIRYAQPVMEQLAARRAQIQPDKRKFMDNLMEIPTEARSETRKFFQNFLERYNVIAAARTYLGKPVYFWAVNVQINDDTDVHLKNHFADVGQPDPPTNYMHIDSTTGVLKCLFYVSEVTEDTGPFSYVLGSNNFKMSLLEYAARKANDTSRLDRCERETRSLFWALPSALQHKAEFGNDLLTTSPGADQLLTQEYQFTSRDGDMIFFDNNNGIHRGSLVKHGQRTILQILMG